MRYFLPLISNELLASVPPGREAIEAAPEPDMRGEALEEFYETALDDAAFSSLKLIIERQPGTLIRVVAAAAKPMKEWTDVESFLVDDYETSVLIAELERAGDQAQMDNLVEQICASSLEWFDGDEREQLASGF